MIRWTTSATNWRRPGATRRRGGAFAGRSICASGAYPARSSGAAHLLSALLLFRAVAGVAGRRGVQGDPGVPDALKVPAIGPARIDCPRGRILDSGIVVIPALRIRGPRGIIGRGRAVLAARHPGQVILEAPRFRAAAGGRGAA